MNLKTLRTFAYLCVRKNQLEDDLIWEMGKNTVICDVTDASENLDRYSYKSMNI